MSNHPDTYHVLVTIPNVTGEECDGLVEDIDHYVRGYGEDVEATYLTPETLPDRYMVNDRTQVHLTNDEADAVWAYLGGRPEEAKEQALRTLLNKLEGR